MNCRQCPSHCCGGSPVKPPILLPSEVNEFKGYSHEVAPGYHRLDRTNGGCIFLDDEQRCLCYEQRPMECRIYPWVFHWAGNRVVLKLHEGCPDRRSAPPQPLPEITKKIPASWWRGFEDLPI